MWQRTTFVQVSLEKQVAIIKTHLLNYDCLYHKMKFTPIIIFRIREGCCCCRLFDLSGETSIKHNSLHFYFVNYKAVNKKMQDNLDYS